MDDGSWFRHPESNHVWSNYTNCVDFEDLQVSCNQGSIESGCYFVYLSMDLGCNYETFDPFVKISRHVV